MGKCRCLFAKEVINVRDGCRLGCICDVCVDAECGIIKELRVPFRNNVFCIFKPEKEYRIPWCNVVRVGSDIILVDVCADEILRSCEDRKC